MAWFTSAPRSRTGVLRKLRKGRGCIDLHGDTSLTVGYTRDELIVTRPALTRAFPLVEVFVIDKADLGEYRLGWSDGGSDYTAYWTPDRPEAKATAFIDGLRAARDRSIRAEDHRLRPSAIRMSMLQLRVFEWEAEHESEIRLEHSVHPTHPDGRPDWGLERTRLGYLAYHQDGTLAFSDLMGDSMLAFHKSRVTKLQSAPHPSVNLPNVRVVRLSWRQAGAETTAYLHFQDHEITALLTVSGIQPTQA
jgi:hypothetical protein